MSAAISTIIMAMLIAAAIPSSAASETAIPYIEIEQPEDGSTVGTTALFVVVAEGQNLQNPSFSVEGGNMGFGAPITGCLFSDSEESGLMRMYCKQKLDLSSFEGQKVRLSVSVSDSDYGIGRILTDSVGLYVSGHCA